MTRQEAIYKIIRGRCVSDASAELSAQEIVKYLDGKCDCKPEETTGWTQFTQCNICGRTVKVVYVIGVDLAKKE